MEPSMYVNTQSGTSKETAIVSSQASSQRKTEKSNEVYSQDKSRNSYSRFHSSETTSSRADSAFGELDTSVEHETKSSSGIFVAQRRTSKSEISDRMDVSDGDSWFASGKKEFDSLIRLDFRTESVGDNEEALKSELLHIFERERMTLEQYFKNRMEELLRSFRNKQQEWEEKSRAERAELEDSMAQEKLEMQRNFGKEIAKLTHTFNEERVQLEQYYKQQMKEMKDQLRQEQQELNEKTAKDKLELKEKLETEYQAMLRVAITDTKQIHQKEKAALESEFIKAKIDMEKQHNLELSEAEANLQRLRTEFENRLNQENFRQEKDFREQQQELEIILQRERESRLETERLLEFEKSNSIHGDGLRKQEIDSLKLELEKLRFQLDEREKNALEIKKFEENILTKGKDGLPIKLREDFDKLLSQHQAELERNYKSDRESLERNLEKRLQTERLKYEEENFREKEKIREEMYREREKSKEETKREREELEGLMKKRFEEEKAQIEERVRKEKDFEIERVRNDQTQLRVNIQSQHTNEQVRSMSSTWNQKHDTSFDRSEHLNNSCQYTNRPNPSSLGGESPASSAHDNILRADSGSYSQVVSPRRENDQRHSHNSREDEEDDNSLSHFKPALNSPRTSAISTNAEYTNYRIKHKHSESPCKDDGDDDYEVSRSFSCLDNKTSGKNDEDTPKESMSRNSFYVSAESEVSLIAEINELRRENEGLKAKIKALEENIELHKTYKAEVKTELERVEQKNLELQQKLNQIRNSSFPSNGQLSIDAEMPNGEYGRQLKEYLDKVEESERRAQSAERKSWDAEIKIKEWKKRALEAEEKVQELQNKLRNVGQEKQNYKEHRQRDGLILRGVVERDSDSKTRSKLHKMSEKDKEKILLAFIKGDIRKVQRSDRGVSNCIYYYHLRCLLICKLSECNILKEYVDTPVLQQANKLIQSPSFRGSIKLSKFGKQIIL